ncbi:ATP-binding cassette domain-containing protein [uncultured Parolsenella sp.]|uniref:ABC transporter ATP-binding protein n=1 Tax=uncultured Parolsenella sp. TaxID=2083008 RepID=UPI0025DDD548|nr:ATP-binding cassette domain-containing protein [uncultured Parolsenella sp.]
MPSASVDNCVAGDRGVASAQAAASGCGATAAAVPAPALEARGLAFRYGEGAGPVFSDLSLTVGRGEVVLVMGASGCGKSTLALCLAGLYPTYAGEVEGLVLAGGRDVAQMGARERSREVSILFQNPDNQFCMDTVEREVLFALENVGYEGSLRDRCHELLALVGLEDRAAEKIGRLSGGLKQKLALCTALACGARTLVLDEPFANLDPASCAAVSAELRRLNAEMGVTLVVVDHRAEWWLPFATRVVLMRGEGSLDDASFSAGEWPAHAGELAAAGLFSGDAWAAGYAPVDLGERGGAGDDAGDDVASCGAVVLAHGLSCGYGRRRAYAPVLKDVSLDVARGSVVALVGACGSGKSTLLHAIAGACETRGSLVVEGRVGLVFQNPRLQFLALTVAEEVLVTLRAANPGASEEELEARVPALLDEFALSGLDGRSPYEISQGQQRRLAMLSMLAGAADVLLLDEPTYAQDERSTRLMLDMLMGRVAAGLTVVMATHDLTLARAIANKVLLVEDGRVREISRDELTRFELSLEGVGER